jgi:hypothetical protein
MAILPFPHSDPPSPIFLTDLSPCLPPCLPPDLSPCPNPNPNPNPNPLLVPLAALLTLLSLSEVALPPAMDEAHMHVAVELDGPVRVDRQDEAGQKLPSFYQLAAQALAQAR